MLSPEILVMWCSFRKQSKNRFAAISAAPMFENVRLIPELESGDACSNANREFAGGSNDVNG
jgi:hypothetical protein